MSKIQKIFILFFPILFLSGLFLCPAQSLAESPATAGIKAQLDAAAGAKGANLGEAQDPRTVAAKIIRTALGVLGTIFLILVLYAGFLWMTAGGNDEDAGTAKKLLFQAVIGLAIVLSAYGITLLVFKMVQGQASDEMNYVIPDQPNWNCPGPKCPY